MCCATEVDVAGAGAFATTVTFLPDTCDAAHKDEGLSDRCHAFGCGEAAGVGTAEGTGEGMAMESSTAGRTAGACASGIVAATDFSEDGFGLALPAVAAAAAAVVAGFLPALVAAGWLCTLAAMAAAQVALVPDADAAADVALLVCDDGVAVTSCGMRK